MKITPTIPLRPRNSNIAKPKPTTSPLAQPTKNMHIPSILLLRTHGAGDIFYSDVLDGDAVCGMTGGTGVFVVLADGDAVFGCVLEVDVTEGYTVRF